MEILLNPNLKNPSLFIHFSHDILTKTKKLNEDSFIKVVVQLRFELEKQKKTLLTNSEIELLICKSLLLDLVAQGWNIKIENNLVKLIYPEEELSIVDIKKKIRRGHLIQRDSQLIINSVREFVNRMESNRLTVKGWFSIFSLMRDGNELSNKLALIQQNSDPNRDKNSCISKVIKPYIQFVENGKICNITGLELMDIWRYFRHTWITPYKVLPGRSISILIRDAATPNHCVIGIAALGSAVAQHSVRDKWIGWESKTFYENLLKNPKVSTVKYLENTLNEIIKNIYIADLKSLGITKKDFENPNLTIIEKLRKLSLEELKKHRLNPRKESFNEVKLKIVGKKIKWSEYSKTHLFKSKRYKLLSSLLRIRMVFIKNNLYNIKTKADFVKALNNNEIRDAIQQLIRKVKADKVGINIMDIIICGAIAPYNSILGGKLICMLLTSPEISEYYKSKYSNNQSIIASSMKGKAVKRKQHLVYLGTTSLYGVGSSQYNRIKIPAEKIDGEKGIIIEYKNLGLSMGFGTFHFSQTTLEYMKLLLARREGGRRVNSIFGEGANPLMRKIRESLDLLELPSEKILNHGNKRIVYGVPLTKNFREFLLGFNKKPNYILSQKDPKQVTDKLINYWYNRWLINRINNPIILEELKKHSLVYPIKHGARIYHDKEEDNSLFLK